MYLDLYKAGRQTRLAVTFACQLAFILFGYDQGVFSGIIANENFLNVVGHPNDTLLGLIVSIYNLGAFSGCILNFFIGDWLGRRRAMWFAMCWIIVGATLQCAGQGRGMIMAGRYIAGIGTGIETSTVPAYQAELTEAHKRGRLVCSEPLFVGVGIVISVFFDLGMSFVGTPVGIAWRLPVACQMIFALLVMILVCGLPESPRYCYYKGRGEEASLILQKVYDAPATDPKIVREEEDILMTIKLEQQGGGYKWRNIFQKDRVSTGYRILLAYGMQFMNQMGGINLVVYYVPAALQDNVGVSRELSLILGGCINVMFIVGSIFPTFFVDKVGRRAPMLWGSFGLGISMMMISILLSFKDTHEGKATSSAAIAFFFIYMLIFGASVNCIPWCYVPEILPLHARAKGSSIGISSNWLWNFFVVMITPILLNRLAYKGYLVFMALNFAFIPLVYFVYPETANLTLEEIDLIFTESDGTVFGTVKNSLEMRKEKLEHGYGRRLSMANKASVDHVDSEERMDDTTLKGSVSNGYGSAVHDEKVG